MAPLSQEEKNALLNKVSWALSETPYACSSLAHLTNGTTNFVFRGELIQPIHKQGSKNIVPATTVIIKHSLEHAALNKNLPIDASRALYEESMLDALNDFPSGVVRVKAPRLYLFLRDTNIQVLEDFPTAVDLKSLFVSPTRDSILTAPVAAAVGHSIGAWLRSFHDWSMSPNAKLRDVLGNNEPMRKLKYAITYDSHLSVLENYFPALLEGHRSALEQVKDAATKEFAKGSKDGDEDKNWGLIHGDFWTGNVLLPGDLLPTNTQYPGAKLFIVDWEFTQFGHRAYDIGQMIGDMYERWHFWEADGAVSAIEGFINGYGVLEDDDLAFRIAIHAGVQLIGWYIRRAPNSPLQFSLEKVTVAMRIGRDWIEKGWQKDRNYFKSTPMASLFKR